MKCSPFSPGHMRRGRHMHHHGRIMEHVMRRRRDSSSSSSSLGEDYHHDIHHHQVMKHRFGHGKKHEKKFGRGIIFGHGRMHGFIHAHGKKHGHGMEHRKSHGHGIEHRKSHGHGMEHRMRHRHGMKHKIHHGHGRKHKVGQGPGMHHKSRFENEEFIHDIRHRQVNIEHQDERNGNEALTFYEPKTKAHITNENNTFHISLDTSYYQPEEVSVKILDGKIDVSAMHESMEENLYEFHEMYRSFNIPNNVNPDVITARLDSDGKLLIEAACNTQEENASGEIDVPVIRLDE